MSSLTVKQIKQYQEEGYVAPIDVLSKEEAKEIRDEIECIEKNGQMNQKDWEETMYI